MRYLYFLVLSLSLIACEENTGSNPTAAAPHFQIVETFETGPGVVVRSLAFEQDKNHLWVGTSHGVLEVDIASGNMVNTFTREHGLANEYVFAISIDSQGYKWFGTNAGGASRYKDGEWQTIFPLHGLADYWVYAFAEQSPDSFWIGTWAGVNQVDLSNMLFKTYLKELINEWVYGIGIDSKNRIWFGTEGGVSRYDGSEWRHWTNKDGLGAVNDQGLSPSNNTGLGTRSRHDLNISVEGGDSYNPNYVFSVKVDSSDNVWFGTWGGGVSRFDGENWVTYTKNDGLAGNVVYSIAIDHLGGFWFGTNNGLSRFNGEEWFHVSVSDGLPGKDVYAISIDANGDVWVGATGGVARLSVQTEEPSS